MFCARLFPRKTAILITVWAPESHLEQWGRTLKRCLGISLALIR